MAKGKKVRSDSSKQYFNTYNYEANRKRRLQKLAKEQPENEQIKNALKNIHYRRKKPINKLGWIDRSDPIFRDSDGKPDIKGKNDALARMNVAVIRDYVSRQLAHEGQFETKSHRPQKGKSKKGSKKSVAA